MKLWLDDNREAPEGWTWVKSAYQAMVMLKRNLVSHVSLDNDLGDKELYGEGHDVARFIEDCAHAGTLPPMMMVVHTQNSVQGDKMMVALRKAITYWGNKGTVIRRPFTKD